MYYAIALSLLFLIVVAGLLTDRGDDMLVRVAASDESTFTPDQLGHIRSFNRHNVYARRIGGTLGRAWRGHRS